jgi:hypothetical protein
MPSITYWNRLEPRPRAPSLADTLAARVRDPLWFLARQWQFGEFRGEDSGSPAYVQMTATSIPLSGWRVGETLRPIGATPVEPLLEREAFPGADLSLQVELWQTFERLLRAQPGLPAPAADDAIEALRASGRYTLTAPASTDEEAIRFHLVCGPRALDGVGLYRDAALAVLPPGVVITDPAARAAVLAALTALSAWVRAVFGDVGTDDAQAWRPERLEYEATLLARADDGAAIELSARPGLDAGLDWYAFDQLAVGGGLGDLPVREPVSIRRSVMPGAVRFRGMPNARWWDFESGTTDFGAISPETPDVATLVVIDMMLVQGNDWFVVPLRQDVGTLCRIDSLVVHDVFGAATLVERSDRLPPPGTDAPWTMFTTTVAGGAPQFGEFLFLPPSVAGVVQTSPPLEEVRFVRDEMANMVWALEHVVQNAIGQPRPGYERGVAETGSAPGAPARPRASLRYRVQTEVPRHWIPFLPVSLDPVRGDIALERGALLDPRVSPAALVRPVGRILQPTRIGTGPYRIREEEVPRAGVRLTRVVFRGRWTDGSTYLWIARERRAGGGEGSSGLRFDIAEPGE